jgi:hypothetical protein
VIASELLHVAISLNFDKKINKRKTYFLLLLKLKTTIILLCTFAACYNMKQSSVKRLVSKKESIHIIEAFYAVSLLRYVQK